MAELAFLKGLTPEQTDAVCDPSKVLCIIAGPGSGKTTVLTRRIALRGLDPGVPPKNTVAITFTNQAADELKSRLASLSVFEMPWVGTLHSFAFQIIRRFHEEIRQNTPRLISRKSRELARILNADPQFSMLLPKRSGPASIAAFEASLLLGEIAREIEAAKVYLIKPDGYAEWNREQKRETGLSGDTIASAYLAYEKEKLRTNQLDFEDLITRAAMIMRDNLAFAQTIRWWFRHFYVDEFQDVNKPQIELLMQLVGEQPNICVVGDPKQAIYAWNGASPHLILEFDRLFPHAAFTYLTANFRSTPEIVELANVAAENFSDPAISHHAGTIYARRQSGASARIFEFSSELDEAKQVANHIYRSISNGAQPDDIAVIARTNSLLPTFQAELSVLGIHSHVAGQNQISNDATLKAAIAHLSKVLGPRGRLHDALAQLDHLIAEYRLDNTSAPETDSPLEYFKRLAIEALRFDARMDLFTFTNWFKVRAAESYSSKKRAVTLTTLHRAKGLEWDNVYLVALEHGILPHIKSTRADAYEEEKRLLYVGITRARNQLYLTHATSRGKSTQVRQRSEFIIPLTEYLFPGASTRVDASRAMRFIAESRTRLSADASASQFVDPIQATLSLWRKRVAAQLSLDPECLLPTRSLGFVASNLPKDKVALSKVPGVSKHFSLNHGDEFLRLVSALERAKETESKRNSRRDYNAHP